MLPKMYVLVRKDLSTTYRLVQGSHALAQYSIENPSLFKVWNNGTIVFLAVSNLTALRQWYLKLKTHGKMFSIFSEPDLDNQETAIACYDLGNIFKELPLAE
jgi:hypothetical protein